MYVYNQNLVPLSPLLETFYLRSKVFFTRRLSEDQKSMRKLYFLTPTELLQEYSILCETTWPILR